MSYSLPLDTDTAAGQPIYVDPAEATHLLADMTSFAWKFFDGLTQKPLAFEWSLEDLSARARANDARKWTRPTPHTTLTCQGTVTRTSFPEVSWNHLDKVARTVVMRVLADVVKELFFPFEGLDDQNKLCRLEPAAADFEGYLNEIKALGVFP